MACGGSSPNLVAASASYTDVNDCHTAAVDGDTISIPSGTSTWTSLLTVTKSISIVGAGIGSTNITIGSGGGLRWNTKATGNSPAGFSRLAHMTLKQAAGSCTTNDGISSTIKLLGNTPNLRVDHVRAESSQCATFHIQGYLRGVVDHCEIVNQTTHSHPLIIEHDTWGNVGSLGDNSWAQDPTIGNSAENMFVEDNTFINAVPNSDNLDGVYMTDDWNGSRTVYRFNELQDAVFANHGTESGGRPRGFRHMQVYRNRFLYVNSAQIESLLGLRGGTGMLWDNYQPNAKANQMFAANTFRRYYNVTGQGYYNFGPCGQQASITGISFSGTTATVTTSGEHLIHPSGSWVTISGVTGSDGALYNGTFIATRLSSTQYRYTMAGVPVGVATGSPIARSPFDGNTNSTGYPCMDQLGRGKGQYYSGYEPNLINPVSPANNALEPVYCWNNQNTVLGVKTLSHLTPQGTTDIFQENRDYYNQNNSFNGTTQHGVGRGSRALRPSSCTAGDAWFSTNQGDWNTSLTETHSADVGLSAGASGVLDLCTATNTWTDGWYTPYVYPHPLVSGVEEDPGGGGTPVDTNAVLGMAVL